VIVSGNFFGVVRAIENLGCRSVTRSAGDVAMRRGVSDDTNEMTAGYTRENPEVNGSHSLPGRHVNAMTMRCAQATSRPGAAHAKHSRAARSAAALYVA
jgi:hypothetical protein